MAENKTIKIVSWNINTRPKAWDEFVDMGADLGLIQESGGVPADIVGRVSVGHCPDLAGHYDRWPLVVGLSDRVGIDYLEPVGPLVRKLEPGQVGISDPSTIAIARVHPRGGESFIVASIYARWIKPRPETKSSWSVGYQDASIHRAISDLSAFIGSTNPSKHRILLAGDFNIILGDTDPSLSLPKRDRTVFDRLEALGLEFVGPRRNPSSPIKSEQKGDPENTPTFYSSRQNPASANRQLDYVFASRGFHNQINVTALNSPEDWGPSDHCRLLLEVGI